MATYTARDFVRAFFFETECTKLLYRINKQFVYDLNNIEVSMDSLY